MQGRLVRCSRYFWKNGETEAGGQLVDIKHVLIDEPHEGHYLMRALQHPNVVKLLHVAHTTLALDLVFEHCKFDLHAALKGSVAEDIGTAASYIRQLCAGMAFIHGNRIIHRDFKPAIFLQEQHDQAFVLKIGDLGCALKCGDDVEKPLNYKVTTMWYRAPEMLLGSRSYDFAVDMWALGCVCVEMVGRAIAFPGIKEDHILDCVFRLFGTPAPHRWASLTFGICPQFCW